jgi:hypothetical protein
MPRDPKRCDHAFGSIFLPVLPVFAASVLIAAVAAKKACGIICVKT